MSFLKDASLLQRHAFINNEWVDADSGSRFPVSNPATGEVLAEVADCSAAETGRAIAAAEAALPGWRAKTATSRAKILRRWNDLIIELVDMGRLGQKSGRGWYRYDDDHSHVCNYSGQSGIMTGIHCNDSYCDDIQIECATPRRYENGAWQAVAMVDCSWTGWYSEEQPPLALGTGTNRFVTGVRCSGSYCDNKQFHVCSLDLPDDSCGGQCGHAAPSGCWCDAACQGYGDCCADYTNVCLP